MFWLAALGAMLAGVAHVGWVLVRVHVLGRLVGSARELPWFSPLTYLACFLVLAIPLALLAHWIPRLASAQLQGAAFATMASAAVFLLLTAIHPLAQLVLSLGIGVQVGRVLARDPARHLRWVRRTTFILAGLLFVAGLPEIVVYRARQRFQLASLPAAGKDAPNVIVLILDTVRAANLGLYGHQRPTSPALDRLGGEGVTFETAIAPAPWTAPSHATLLSGRYPFHTGISYIAPMADSIPTITQTFRANGYATGAFMGNAYYAGRGTGFDRGFIRFDDYPATISQALWSATFTQLDVVTRVADAVRDHELWRLRRTLRRPQFRIIGEHRGDRNSADQIADNFISWRDGVGQRPYFAMLNFFDAHAPYTSPMQARFNGGRKEIDRYDGAIAFEDSIVGSLLQRLQERGDLDRTIVVVTADHGEMFGEHGLNQHGNSLYLELLHVPLLVSSPGRVPAGLRVSRVVSLRDVPATLLDLAGLRDEKITGQSLAALWRVPTAPPLSNALSEAEHPPNQSNQWPTSFGPMKSLVTDEFHYIRRGDGQERVYAWKGDTTGRGDLTSTTMGAQAIDQSRQTFGRLFGPHWVGRSTPQRSKR